MLDSLHQLRLVSVYVIAQAKLATDVEAPGKDEAVRREGHRVMEPTSDAFNPHSFYNTLDELRPILLLSPSKLSISIAAPTQQLAFGVDAQTVQRPALDLLQSASQLLRPVYAFAIIMDLALPLAVCRIARTTYAFFIIAKHQDLIGHIICLRWHLISYLPHIDLKPLLNDQPFFWWNVQFHLRSLMLFFFIFHLKACLHLAAEWLSSVCCFAWGV